MLNANVASLYRAGRPNLDDDRWLLCSVAAFPAFFIVVSLCVKAFTPRLYFYAIREDGLIEWATALGFAVAGGFAALLASRLWRDRRVILSLLYAGLAAGMAFAALEEISWGQRVFGIESPEYFVEHSTKEEINVHNLRQFPLEIAFIIVGFYGAFARLMVPRSLKRRFPFEVDLLTPRYAVATYFLPTFLLFAWFEYVYYTVIRPLGITIPRNYRWDDHFIIGKDQEPVELLLATGFLVFVLNNWQRHRALNLANTSAKPAAAGR